MRKITKDVSSLKIVKLALLVLIIIFLTLSLLWTQDAFSSSYPTVPIVFSNISDNLGDYPTVCYSTTRTGYNVNGHIYVKFQDLGFTPSILPITWNLSGFTGTEGKIRVFFYNGQDWSLVVSSLDLANGSYDLDLSTQTIVDPLRCRVRVGIYNPVTGNWLTWTQGNYSGQYYDESGHFWVENTTPATKYIQTTYPLGNEAFSPTSTIPITWSVSGFVGTEGKVRVYFYNGQDWSIVAYNLNLASGSYYLDLSNQTIVDPLRCRVRVGIYVPSPAGSQYGDWLTWIQGNYSGQYYDESGHFWAVSSSPTNKYIQTTSPLGNEYFYCSGFPYTPLGATFTTAPGPTYVLQINGQSNYFYPASTTSYSSVNYSILDKSTGQTTPYFFTFSGTIPIPSPVMVIDGYPCVWVQYAAYTLGSLIGRWDSSNNRYIIYHWRVNGNTPLSDSNTYLVGGEWLSNWDNNFALDLSPNFKLGDPDNIWSNYKPSSHPYYNHQVKVSQAVLQSMENTRYLMGNTPYSPSCVFRSYWYNKDIGGWKWSWHMKGRAMDAGTSVMRETVRSDISAVLGYDDFLYSTNSNSVTQWDEIENSDLATNWLHGQRAPSDQDNRSGPVPHCP
ncbi:MAG: hypothetical protein ACP5QX_07135 [Caldisericaceae bacterium]